MIAVRQQLLLPEDLLMLIGRVGVLTLILGMVARPKPKLYDFATEEVTLG